MTANFSIEKYTEMLKEYSCEYSIGIIIAPLKENIAGTNFFLEMNILNLKNHSKNG